MNHPLRFSLLTIAVGIFGFFAFAQNTYAEVVDVSCSGTSGSPTAVTEADLAGDDVTFIDAGGDGWCVLDNPISASSVVISTGVVITHVAEDSDGVTISTTGNFEIQSGAYINADGKGCVGGTGVGQGPDAVTGICASSTTGYGHTWNGGAAHGGNGGRSADNDSSTTATYGSSTEPILFGSGGAGGGGETSGGAGGGKIRLDVVGTLTVSGAISANGGNGTSVTGAALVVLPMSPQAFWPEPVLLLSMEVMVPPMVVAVVAVVLRFTMVSMEDLLWGISLRQKA